MDAKNALNIVAGLCSKKEYCLQEIREKLKKWDITEKDTARILDFLIQNKFIDETALLLHTPGINSASTNGANKKSY